MEDKLREAIGHIEATKPICKSKHLKEAREILQRILEEHGGDAEELRELARVIGQELRGYLSVGEACAIVDNLNGVMLLPGPTWRYEAGSIAHNLEDGCRLDDLDQKWEIDGQELVAKVMKMPPHQVWWLTYSVRKFWSEQTGEFTREDIRNRFACAAENAD